MKTFEARTFGVAFVVAGGVSAPLDPRLDLVSLSPGGFTWGKYGYAGGDRQLALAILAAVYDDEKALCLFEQFAERAIYTKAKDGPFKMTLDQVMAHVEAIEKVNADQT